MEGNNRMRAVPANRRYRANQIALFAYIVIDFLKSMVGGGSISAAQMCMLHLRAQCCS
jgi:hypothetical protein